MALKRLAPLLVALLLAACAGSTPAATRCAEPKRARAEPGAPESAPAPSASAPPVVAVPYDLPRSEDVAPLPVDLPHAAGAEPVSAVLGVEIAADGSIFVAGKAVQSDAELKRVAKEFHDRDPDVRAVIRADRSATWGTVIHVMDLLKQAAIAKIAFAVSAPSP